MSYSDESDNQSFLQSMRKYVPFLILFNGALAFYLYILHSDDAKPVREVGKAVAWYTGALFTKPPCELRNYCYTITQDADAGTLKSYTVLSEDHALSIGWSVIETTTGTYYIHGSSVAKHEIGEPVKLFVEKSGQRNMLCIDQVCYRVPYKQMAATE